MKEAGGRFEFGGFRTALHRMILVSAVSAASACTTTAPPPAPPARAALEATGLRPLPSDQLKQFLVGNTLYHIDPATGNKVPLYYMPDGTRYVKLRGQQFASKWRVERDMVCEGSVVAKRDVCRSIFRPEAGRGVICEEGEAQCGFWMEWAAGNRESLGK